MAVHVDVHDDVPFFLGHVHEDPVAYDAGVVHEYVEVPERLDRGAHHVVATVPVRHVVGVGDRLAAHLLDLVHDPLSRCAVVARAVDRASEIVDHDLGAFAGKQERVLPTDPAARTGDDRNPAFECTHDRALP